MIFGDKPKFSNCSGGIGSSGFGYDQGFGNGFGDIFGYAFDYKIGNGYGSGDGESYGDGLQYGDGHCAQWIFQGIYMK